MLARAMRNHAKEATDHRTLGSGRQARAVPDAPWALTAQEEKLVGVFLLFWLVISG